jgi:hypothetical protein
LGGSIRDKNQDLWQKPGFFTFVKTIYQTKMIKLKPSLKPILNLAIASLLAALAGCTTAPSNVGRICQYDATKDPEKILGQKAELIVQEQGGNTIFTYQSLPSVPVAENITLNAKRELVFKNTQLDTARVIMLQNQPYFNQLVGEEKPKGFAAVNQFLTCQ